MSTLPAPPVRLNCAFSGTFTASGFQAKLL
jgi:hypothetical protein